MAFTALKSLLRLSWLFQNAMFRRTSVTRELVAPQTVFSIESFVTQFTFVLLFLVNRLYMLY